MGLSGADRIQEGKDGCRTIHAWKTGHNTSLEFEREFNGLKVSLPRKIGCTKVQLHGLSIVVPLVHRDQKNFIRAQTPQRKCKVD